MSAVTSLDWIDPETAFHGLHTDVGALLLHGGKRSASRLYVSPTQIFHFNQDTSLTAYIRDLRQSLSSAGQVAGLFGYEMGTAFEPSAKGYVSNHPVSALGHYLAWAEFDPATRQLSVHGEAKAREALIEGMLKAGAAPSSGHGALNPVWSKEAYIRACQTLIDHIRAGDIYQANLSQRFSGSYRGDPWAVFYRLVQQSDAPHAAYFRLSADMVVISNSPERFLRLADGQVESRPIKGTRPRYEDPLRDQAMKEELHASAKDRAENLMIVDLVRHDLSRVCEVGSVKVPSLNVVESYANVHHLVSRVTGKLHADADGLDLVAAAFPPGSITGAPKIRAMQLISDAEGEPRGPYCGALGWLGKGGQVMDLNVMIRTLSFAREADGWQVNARSGGAITIDSDPVEEYAETLHKLSALKAALEAR